MPKETVLIGCRLPSGLVLHHPQNRELTVKISGTSSAPTEGGLYLPPKSYETTEVDAEFWAAWKAAYVGFPPLKTRALFEAKSEQEASSKAKEAKNEKTGFEQIPKTAGGVKPDSARE
jgi:hypothetical protein